MQGDFRPASARAGSGLTGTRVKPQGQEIRAVGRAHAGQLQTVVPGVLLADTVTQRHCRYSTSRGVAERGGIR